MEKKQFITYLLLIFFWLGTWWSVSIVSCRPIKPSSNSDNLVGHSTNQSIRTLGLGRRKSRQISELARHNESSSDDQLVSNSIRQYSPDLQNLIHVAAKTIKEQANRISGDLLILVRVADAESNNFSSRGSVSETRRLIEGEINTILSTQTKPVPSPSQTGGGLVESTNHQNDAIESSAVLKSEQLNFTATCCLNLLERFIEAIN